MGQFPDQEGVVFLLQGHYSREGIKQVRGWVLGNKVEMVFGLRVAELVDGVV